MKRIVALFAFILVATFANAQQAQTTTSANAERAHSQAIRLQKQLGLTQDQVTKVEAVMLAKINAIDAVNADVNKSKEQKDTEIAQIRSDKEQELIAIFTPEQATKYAEMKAQRQQRRNATNQE